MTDRINLDTATPEQVEDYLAWVNTTPPVSNWRPLVMEKLTETKAWADIQGRASAFKPLATELPPQPEPTRFDLDVLHNQHLMKGSTEFDGASFSAPDLRQTETVRWFQCDFGPSNRYSGLIMSGPGTGKTWGCLAYINSIARINSEEWGEIRGSNAAFVSAFRLSEMYHNPKRYQDELDRLERKQILLIDDLGLSPAGFRGADFLVYFEALIAERQMYKRITLVTSNHTTSQVKEMYGPRFVSRFSGAGLLLETTEGDMRGAS